MILREFLISFENPLIDLTSEKYGKIWFFVAIYHPSINYVASKRHTLRRKKARACVARRGAAHSRLHGKFVLSGPEQHWWPEELKINPLNLSGLWKNNQNRHLTLNLIMHKFKPTSEKFLTYGKLVDVTCQFTVPHADPDQSVVTIHCFRTRRKCQQKPKERFESSLFISDRPRRGGRNEKRPVFLIKFDFLSRLDIDECWRIANIFEHLSIHHGSWNGIRVK